MDIAANLTSSTNWAIPRLSGASLPLSLNVGDCLFVVGPNGSGKSALIQHLVTQHEGRNVRRIPAHRQTWLGSGSLELTPLSRKEFEQRHTDLERNYEALWQEYEADQKQAAVLFDLVARENTRARSITSFVDGNDLEKASKLASKSVSAFAQLNDLLVLGALPIDLENSNDEEILAKNRRSNASYSIAQMSDGERNAAILGATVVTAKAGTVLLIDEPERHLHRSIIVPFLAALFAKRGDCTFVISTHELTLPTANPAARILMVRSCEWESNRAKAWDIDLLEPNAKLPEELQLAILGSRRKVLFIEGTGTSLDVPIYNALFPDISVEASGTSTDVQKAVEGMRASQDLHHVQAYGLIDRDGRSEEKVNSLSDRGIFALNVYSVESLYCCDDSLDAVARWQAQSLGRDPDTMRESALQAAFEALGENGLAERMAARRCEHLVKGQIIAQAPDWKTIRDQARSDFQISLQSPFQDELATFRELLKNRDFDQLVARYPLRDSRVFDEVARALEFKREELYGQTLIARVQSDAILANKLRERIGPLTLAFNGQSKEPVEKGDSTQEQIGGSNTNGE